MCSFSSFLRLQALRWGQKFRGFERITSLTYRRELSQKGNLIRMSSRDLFLTDFASREAQYFQLLLFCFCFFAPPFVSSPFEFCFLESDDNWSVWLMCEFCLAPRPRTSTPISSVHQKALSESSSGSRDRRLTGLNMIGPMRKWAMTWEVEWKSINVECDVRVSWLLGDSKNGSKKVDLCGSYVLYFEVRLSFFVLEKLVTWKNVLFYKKNEVYFPFSRKFREKYIFFQKISNFLCDGFCTPPPPCL